MWSAICSSTPHLQFAESPKPHQCIVKRNSPTPVRRRFSLTREGLGRIISGGDGPGDGINVWRREVFFCHSVFNFWSAQKAAVVLDLSKSFSSSSAVGTKGCLDLGLILFIQCYSYQQQNNFRLIFKNYLKPLRHFWKASLVKLHPIPPLYSLILFQLFSDIFKNRNLSLL